MHTFPYVFEQIAFAIIKCAIYFSMGAIFTYITIGCWLKIKFLNRKNEPLSHKQKQLLVISNILFSLIFANPFIIIVTLKYWDRLFSFPIALFFYLGVFSFAIDYIVMKLPFNWKRALSINLYISAIAVLIGICCWKCGPKIYEMAIGLCVVLVLVLFFNFYPSKKNTTVNMAKASTPVISNEKLEICLPDPGIWPKDIKDPMSYTPPDEMKEGSSDIDCSDMNKSDTISDRKYWHEYGRLEYIFLKLKNSKAKRGCRWCKHLHDDGYTCDAFPDRKIPFFFINGTKVHDEPFPGDRSIQFERK